MVQVNLLQEADSDEKLPPLLPEQDILDLLGHDNYWHRKWPEVSQFFREQSDLDARIAFLKETFNDDYSEVMHGAVRLGYKTYAHCLEVWKGSYLSAEARSTLTWGSRGHL